MSDVSELRIADEMRYAVECPVSGIDGHLGELMLSGVAEIERLDSGWQAANLENLVLATELERKDAAIAELVGALKNVLPEVSVCGLSSQLAMVRELIAKYESK